MSTPELDLDLAETLLNWDTMSRSHGAGAPPTLQAMTVSRREALVARVRAVQAVAHAYVEARAQGCHDDTGPLSLRITETDRQVFNRLLRPARPAHFQLKNQGGRAYVELVEQENLSPPAHQQIVELARLVLSVLRGEVCDIVRCANPKCDKGAHKRAKLFLRPLDRRARTRYCSTECRRQAKELQDRAAARDRRKRAPHRPSPAARDAQVSSADATAEAPSQARTAAGKAPSKRPSAPK